MKLEQQPEIRGQFKETRGIDPKIVDRERKHKYKISRVDRFRYWSRYFTDAGIIGSREFVSEALVK